MSGSNASYVGMGRLKDPKTSAPLQHFFASQYPLCHERTRCSSLIQSREELHSIKATTEDCDVVFIADALTTKQEKRCGLDPAQDLRPAGKEDDNTAQSRIQVQHIAFQQDQTKEKEAVGKANKRAGSTFCHHMTHVWIPGAPQRIYHVVEPVFYTSRCQMRLKIAVRRPGQTQFTQDAASWIVLQSPLGPINRSCWGCLSIYVASLVLSPRVGDWQKAREIWSGAQRRPSYPSWSSTR